MSHMVASSLGRRIVPPMGELRPGAEVGRLPFAVRRGNQEQFSPHACGGTRGLDAGHEGYKGDVCMRNGRAARFQNGKNNPTPQLFFEECENARLRGYGTWKNIRKIGGSLMTIHPHPPLHRKECGSD